MQTTPQIAPVAYVPKRVTNAAMLAYLLALVACNTLYISHALPLEWWVFGLVEVLGFFYMTNHLTKAWIYEERILVSILTARSMGGYLLSPSPSLDGNGLLY